MKSILTDLFVYQFCAKLNAYKVFPCAFVGSHFNLHQRTFYSTCVISALCHPYTAYLRRPSSEQRAKKHKSEFKKKKKTKKTRTEWKKTSEFSEKISVDSFIYKKYKY